MGQDSQLVIWIAGAAALLVACAAGAARRQTRPTSRWLRGASAALAVAAATLAAAGLVQLVDYAPTLLGAQGSHLAGDAAPWVLVVLVPVAAGAVLALVAALRLWAGDPTGPAPAWAWIVFAGMASGLLATTWNNVLWVAATGLTGGSWSYGGGRIVYVWPAGEQGSGAYFGYVDDPMFWLPGVVLICAAVATACLIAASRRTARTEPTP
jgi:hypothetical protein